MAETKMLVNGEPVVLDVPPQVSLLDGLRDRLGLTGPKKGCDQGACGACTVLADGERIVSCLALAVQYDGREITTVEGVANLPGGAELQREFIKRDGFQCGFCTSGQICSALGMLAERESAPTREEIREGMSGNLCRCGAYNGIVDAIEGVAR
ncbi:2Fe-2S iron-sulfur cluster-binding protein [Allokutzneria multivorans]|uniref:2Fe-2S iron-sulfur cluster-binding protein n=1 Tax=Allokutzneria multivorans TaxID=1142134 RepID=A0ABP7TCP7_9PSEU